MARTSEIHDKAKRFKDRPVCVTLHNGETYIGYISGVNNEGVMLSGGGKLAQSQISTTKTKTAGAARSASSKMKPKSAGAGKTTSSRSRKKVNGARKSCTRSRVASRTSPRQAQVSSFMPMMGSLLGGFGGLGGAGAVGGMLGGGMRLFGMIQRFVPVVKMGYGMIKQIQPFMGAVQGLMTPQNQAQATQVEAEAEEQEA
nr:hypothetical protein [Paenibacillus xylanexedens]